MKYLNDINYKDCVGKVYKSKSSGDFKILKYNDSRNVVIQFLKTGFETVARLDHIKSGEVKDPYSPSVFDVGIVGTNYPATVNGRITKEYNRWHSMLERCYSDTSKKKTQLMKVVKHLKTLSLMNISMNGVINKLDLITKVGI